MNLQLSNLIQPRTLGLGNSQYWERRINPEEIKKFLESKEDRDIVEGLTLLIAALSKGTNLQHLFPNIAILIAKQNPEIKKMIYICLGHYAELEQTTALLAINILEKDLANPNQLVRAHALRTISNVRVKMITRLLITAVEGGTKDTSAYVRKTAAHAVLKLWSLDPSQKEVLTECIERLLNDRENSVFGSAAAAYNEICPENYEIIHKIFRKLCTSLLDIDEWGQQHVLALLTRYVRVHFVDPDIEIAAEKKEEEAVEEGEEKEEDDFISGFDKVNKLDPDHRLALDCCLPLLKSRSPGVVMSVVTLYQYCAPQNERHKVVKALIRFLRDSREIQYCILNSIHSIALSEPTLFQPYLADFFLSGGESSFTRQMKLDILTAIADEANIDRILKEFKFYVLQDDKLFVAHTIQAIGRCAITLPESLERCISQLMSLLSSKSEVVVAESVVVLKQLLQMPRKEGISYDSVIKQLARLFSKVTSPKAKASIIWVVGEYVDVISQYAPDILRQLAKEFASETNDVKMQIMNLAVKLLLTNPEQTSELAHYIFFMAKFDTNYDIRDKARMIRFLLPQNNENPNTLQKLAKSLLLSTKPSPQLGDSELLKNKHVYGSLSHLLRQTVPGYTALPEWALVPSDPSLRKLVIATPSIPESHHPNYSPQKEFNNNNNNIRVFDKDLDSFLQKNPGEEYYEEDEEYYDEEYEGEYDEDYEGEYEEGEYDDIEYEEGTEYDQGYSQVSTK